MVEVATTNLKTLNGTHPIPTLPVSMLRPCLRSSAHRHPPINTQAEGSSDREEGSGRRRLGGTSDVRGLRNRHLGTFPGMARPGRWHCA